MSELKFVIIAIVIYSVACIIHPTLGAVVFGFAIGMARTAGRREGRERC